MSNFTSKGLDYQMAVTTSHSLLLGQGAGWLGGATARPVRQRGAAVRSNEATVIGQTPEVTTDRGWPDADLLAEVLDRDRATETHELDEAVVAIAVRHAQIVSIRCVECQ